MLWFIVILLPIVCTTAPSASQNNTQIIQNAIDQLKILNQYYLVNLQNASSQAVNDTKRYVKDAETDFDDLKHDIYHRFRKFTNYLSDTFAELFIEKYAVLQFAETELTNNITNDRVIVCELDTTFNRTMSSARIEVDIFKKTILHFWYQTAKKVFNRITKSDQIIDTAQKIYRQSLLDYKRHFNVMASNEQKKMLMIVANSSSLPVNRNCKKL